MTQQTTTTNTSPLPARSGWLQTLPDDRREAVYAVMRAIGDDADRAREEHERLRPRYGEVAVGAAHMDPFFRMEAAHEFLAGLRRGERPAEAGIAAQSAVLNAVRLHNGHRPRDVDWHRWERTCDGLIARLIVRVMVAAMGADR